MKFYRVRIPVLRVLPIRKIETGMTTEQAVFGRNDAVIAESGTPITEQRKHQFEEHGVRRVVVTEERLQWVSEKELSGLSEDLEVIEERSFSDATQDIVESLLDNNSVRQMRNVAQHLRSKAKRAGDSNVMDRLDTMIERSYELEEEIQEISDRLDEVEDSEARESLYEALEGAVNELESTFLEITAPDSILNDSLRAINEREDFRRELINLVDDHPEFFEDDDDDLEFQADVVTEDSMELQASDQLKESISSAVDPDPDDDLKTIIEKNIKSGDLPPDHHEHYEKLKTDYDDLEAFFGDIMDRLQLEVNDESMLERIVHAVNAPDTLDEPLSSLPISDELAERISDYWDRTEAFQKRLWETSQDVGSMDVESLKNALDDFSDGEIDDGLNQLEKWAERGDGQDTTELKAQLQLLQKRNGELESESQDLKEQLRESDLQGDDLETILEMIRGEREYDPAVLMEADIDPRLKERIGDYFEQREDFKEDLLSTTDDVSGGLLSEGAEHDEELRESLQEVEEQMDASVSEKQQTSSEQQSELANGSDGSGKEQISPESFDTIVEYVKNRDHVVIAREKGLKQDTVENAKNVMEIPGKMNATQSDIVEPVYELLLEAFYNRKLPEDDLSDLVHRTAETMTTYGKPIKLFLNPKRGDKYLVSHSVNCFMSSILLGAYAGLDDQELLDLGAASLCGDLGMVEISKSVWAKDAELQKHERRRIHQHPNQSKHIVEEAVNGDIPIMDLVQQHHERADGSGYPKKLAGDDLHPKAPTLGIADTYTAMLETRQHRPRRMPDKALNVIIDNKDQYNGTAIKSLMYEVGIYPNGCVGLLSDGRLCVVKSQNKDEPLSPEVFVLTDHEQSKLDSPFVFDLTDDPSVRVKKLIRF